MDSITTDSPESGQFQGMDEAALDSFLDQNEAKPEPQSNAVPQAPTQPGPTVNPSPPQQTNDEKMAALERKLEAFSKEAGQARALQSRIAQLENARTQAQAQKTAPTQDPNLTPEQRQAQSEFEAYLEARLEKMTMDKYGKLIEMGNRNLAESQQAEEVGKYREGLVGLCKEFEIPFDEVNPIMVKIVNETVAAKDSGDEQATARLARILGTGGENYLFTLAAREREKQVQGQAQSFQQGKADSARAASQTMRSTTQVQSTGGKKLADMSPEEMAKLPEAELDKLMDGAGIR